MNKSLNSSGFLTILYNHQAEVVLPLFLATESIKNPSVLQSIFDEVTQVIAEVYQGDYKRIEDISVYDFSKFRFYEYGLSKEEIYLFAENEIYDFDSQCLKKELFRKHLIEIKNTARKYTYPRNIVGAVARDNNFYGRQEFILQLWETLHTKSIFLSAPRRFGKTSIMYRMYDHPSNNWQVTHLELQHIESPAEFVSVIIKSLNPDSTTEATEGTWKEEGSRFFESLGQEKILFLLDEFLYMLKNFKVLVSEFSEWFQSQRQSASNCRFLIASSDSLNFCLKQHGIKEDFPDFVEKRIPPLSKEEAIGFIDEILLSENIRLGLNLKERILDLVGTPVPYFIQLILAEVLNYYATSQVPLSEEVLEKIYSERILGPDCKQYFHYFFEQLSMHPFEFRNAAGRLLKELSARNYVDYQELWELYKESSGKEDSVEFESILTYLEDEFYIKKDEDRTYSFFCSILKDWWQRNRWKV